VSDGGCVMVSFLGRKVVIGRRGLVRSLCHHRRSEYTGNNRQSLELLGRRLSRRIWLSGSLYGGALS
jgi:hypothetical protein